MSRAEWVALSLIRGVGAATLRALIARFGDVGGVLAAPPDELQQVRGVGPTIAKHIAAIQPQQAAARLAHWESRGVQIVTLHDTSYPQRLAALHDAPPTLFMRGNPPPAPSRPCVAIVGTRSPDEGSTQRAWDIARKLSAHGASVVSGLAHGIDTSAHQAAITVAQSHPLAVLGNGILAPYPPQNRPLAELVIQWGTLMSEVAPDASVSAAGLVARNRIITGLSDAVVIVQSSADGGAMHAARAAMRQGRPVFAGAHPASGNQTLMQQGATPLGDDLAPLMAALHL